MPDFFFALLLQLVSWCRAARAVRHPLFYVQGKYSVGEEGNIVNLLQHMALPVPRSMLTSVAAWSRYQRDSMLDVLHTDYVRTAQAKGVPAPPGHPPARAAQRAHPVRHRRRDRRRRPARRRGRGRDVFSWPGLGLLFFDALSNASDYPVILAWMAVATVFVVLFNLLADILYGALDPRDPCRSGPAHRRAHGVPTA